MLRTMDELERTVNDLLEKLQDKAPPGSGSLKKQDVDGKNQEYSENREAAELVKRAIKRLKSL